MIGRRRIATCLAGLGAFLAVTLIFVGQSVAEDSLSTPLRDGTKNIAVTQIVEHPSLDATREGIKDELAARGWVEGQNLVWRYESAQNAVATSAQIARSFVGLKPDLIIALSTLSAQTAAAAAGGEVPVLFSVVTDPVGAKLVKALEAPGRNVTGTTDALPVDRQLAMMKQAVPNLKKLGFVYNPGEQNAVATLQAIKAAGAAQGITVVESVAPKLSDILTAGRNLVGRVDAIYASTDNTVVSGIESLVKVAYDNQVPVFSGDTDSVARGTAAALGFNYYKLGRRTGQMAAKILDGTPADSLPVETLEDLELHINPASAARMGLTFSLEMRAEAAYIVE